MMKQWILLTGLLAFLWTGNVAARQRQVDLSGELYVRAEMKESLFDLPVGTPMLIRQVVKITGSQALESGIYYVADAMGIQHPLSELELASVRLLPPESDQEFWQQAYLKGHMYHYFYNNGYRNELRQEVEEECQDYLRELEEIAYQDDYLTSYVQGVFAKLHTSTIDANRIESLNVRLIQSPDPDAYMLPNGAMLISTGLLCTVDSEDELAAVIACELGHFVLDHQVDNIRRAEQRANRAEFWANVLGAVAVVAEEDGDWTGDRSSYAVSAMAGVGCIAALLSAPAVDRLGMRYKTQQEVQADRLACDLLAFKGYNPAAMASALSKIAAYYEQSHRTKDMVRYNSLADLQKRIEKAGSSDGCQPQRSYLKKTSDVVTFNALMKFNAKRYQEALRTAKKNVENRLATDNDYVILVKSNMALVNSEEANRQCMEWLDTAQELAGDSPNLEIQKQRVLLLLRMDKQMQAGHVLEEYLQLLERYQAQGIEGEEKEWAEREMAWSRQMLGKIRRI